MRLDEYIWATQGCYPHGWPEERIAELESLARQRLTARGIEWGSETVQQLESAEDALVYDDAANFMQDVVEELRPTVSDLMGVYPPFEVDIRVVDEDTSSTAWLGGGQEGDVSTQSQFRPDPPAQNDGSRSQAAGHS